MRGPIAWFLAAGDTVTPGEAVVSAALPDTRNRVVSPDFTRRPSMTVGPVALPRSGYATWDDLAT
jgi:hypothetical protein